MVGRTIVVRRDVQAEQKREADAERELLGSRGTLVVNMVSSPGAGKTSLLAEIAQHWQGRHSMAVLVGDIETDRDAQRLAPFVPVTQLTTGGACHLELPLVYRGRMALGDPQVDFLFIENIGNLVCPASHDLGEHLRVVLLSVTDGDDKPAKYPKMFRTSHALIISKCDLLNYVPFRTEEAIRDAKSIQPKLSCFEISSLRRFGISELCRYFENERLRRVGSPIREKSNESAAL
ncbi:MAG: hydrogenase nickel incorporation protein HypB [Planctomycetes bacterium]|nr:hydrogenase nickel incorporation protein HypB [Planctomycetota bacterium]